MSELFSFGAWVRRRRRALDLTREELAPRVGCSVVTIRRIETDERRPSKQLAARLADCLEIPPAGRAAFVKAARAELTVDQLESPTQSLEHALPNGPSRAREDPDLPLAFAPLRNLSHTRTNLPAQLTTLVGRAHEVAQICTLLRRGDVRLLTLSGPGGIGKTRLALQVSAELLDHFVDGVSFVDLAPISDPMLVESTIAVALGIKETAGQPLIETLKRYLHEKQKLLLLDNFEQVVEAAPVVAELLKAAPMLTALITSRTILHLSGEHKFSVPPLTLPEPHHVPPLDQLSQYTAVALFVERAWAVKADFQVSIVNAPAVAEICRRLDGLPLAIELAAARIKLFAPEELLARLNRRLPLLIGGPRDMPARQQTLRATIEWSYQLLDQAQQLLFTRLAVFVGGWTLHAAEAICNLTDDLEIAVLDGLQSLLDQSLLRQVEGPDERSRFRRLETIREYALERLAESGEAEALQQRHSEYFLWLAEQAEPELRGVEQAVWLARLEAEYDNLRAALEWARQRHNVELGAQLAGALWRFWEARGLWSEGSERLAVIAPKTPPDALPRTPAWARMLQGRAVLAFYLGDHTGACELFEHSLARFRELKDQAGIGWTLIYYGWQINDSGNPLAARQLFEESLVIFRALGERKGMGWALARLGLVHLFLGELPAARPVLEQSLALCRAVGDRWGTAWTLQLLGVVVGELGDAAAAIALQVESLGISRALGDRRNMAYTQAILSAYLTLNQGEHVEARRLITEALRGQHQIGDHWGMALGLWVAAVVSAAQGQVTRVVRLESASAAQIKLIGAVLPLAASPRFTQILQVSRQTLSEDEQERAWTEGQAMTLDQAIAYACGQEE